MSTIKSYFVTPIYHASLSDLGTTLDNQELVSSCWSIAEDDEAGQEWCDENGYPGYTSYASLTDLGWRFPIFAELIKILDQHVAAFVQELDFNLDGRELKLEDILDQYLARRWHAFLSYSSPLCHFGHHLCFDARRGKRDQI